MTAATKPPHTRRPYGKSGFHGASAALSKGGLSALDGRSALARAVRDWRLEVESDLGGPAALSQAQQTLLDVAAKDVALLHIADSFLLELGPAVVNRRRRALVPLVDQRMRVASHLAELLKTLGLRRSAKELPRLAAVMRRGAQGPGESA